eukprot:6181762-Pleurochrysis_carterae.AAC.3
MRKSSRRIPVPDAAWLKRRGGRCAVGWPAPTNCSDPEAGFTCPEDWVGCADRCRNTQRCETAHRCVEAGITCLGRACLPFCRPPRRPTYPSPQALRGSCTASALLPLFSCHSLSFLMPLLPTPTPRKTPSSYSLSTPLHLLPFA